jgi:hypothetical protein
VWWPSSSSLPFPSPAPPVPPPLSTTTPPSCRWVDCCCPPPQSAPPPFCTRRLPQSPLCRCPRRCMPLPLSPLAVDRHAAVAPRAFTAIAACRIASAPAHPHYGVAALLRPCRRSVAAIDALATAALTTPPPRYRRAATAAPPRPRRHRLRRHAAAVCRPHACLSRPAPAILLPTAMLPPPASAGMPSPPQQPPPSTSPHRHRTRRRAATLAGRPQCRRTMRGVIGSCLVTAHGRLAASRAALHGAATGAHRQATEGGGARAVMGEAFEDSAGPRRMQVGQSLGRALRAPRGHASDVSRVVRTLG